MFLIEIREYLIGQTAAIKMQSTEHDRLIF